MVDLIPHLVAEIAYLRRLEQQKDDTVRRLQHELQQKPPPHTTRELHDIRPDTRLDTRPKKQEEDVLRKSEETKQTSRVSPTDESVLQRAYQRMHVTAQQMYLDMLYVRLASWKWIQTLPSSGSHQKPSCVRIRIPDDKTNFDAFSEPSTPFACPSSSSSSPNLRMGTIQWTQGGYFFECTLSMLRATETRTNQTVTKRVEWVYWENCYSSQEETLYPRINLLLQHLNEQWTLDWNYDEDKEGKQLWQFVSSAYKPSSSS